MIADKLLIGMKPELRLGNSANLVAAINYSSKSSPDASKGTITTRQSPLIAKNLNVPCSSPGGPA